MPFSAAIRPARKIPCAHRREAGRAARSGRWVGMGAAMVLVAAAALLALGAAAARAARPPQIEAASVAQKGRDLVLTVRTAKPVPLAKLAPRPDIRRAGVAYLCFGFEVAARSQAASRALGRSSAGGAAEARLCVGGPKARKSAGMVAVSAAGKPLSQTSLPATLRRPKPDKLVVSLVDGPAPLPGLGPGHDAWRVLASTGACQVRRECTASYPQTGSETFRLRPVRAVGCTGGNTELVSDAVTGRKVVALTFDDGPSEYTERFLDVLREKDVPGTFFEIGQEMPGREAIMRRILREGDEIGDHTENHVEYPGYAQIADAANRIEEYTGFTPCLFRPPGGAVNSSVIATAGSLGMKTITWDVDPRDWSLPGTAEIYSNITGNAGPGSIILMHDGGGPRDETLAALPQVIDTLRAKGYAFETVSELLGDELIYRPYG